MAHMAMNRRFLLARRPIGTPRPDDFLLIETSIPLALDESFVVRNRYASLDLAHRGRRDDPGSEQTHV
jgi:NADPH-dependent curcumin reductase CurA